MARLKSERYGVLALVSTVVITSNALAHSVASYSAADAARHIGEYATVTDKVDGAHQSGKGNIFLKLDCWP